MRRRSRAPGRVRPDRRRSLLFLCLSSLLVAAACIGPRDATQAPTGDGTATEPPGTLTTEPSDTAAATSEPAPTTDPATPEPLTPDPASAEPSLDPSASPSSEPGSVAACSGNDGNREFFASIAEVVSWPVYCAVLPSGWFVDAGRYRLAGGGWLEIAYRGPGGTRIELREGTACTEQACLPSGEDLGPASFGGMAGSLVRLDDGGLAVVVPPNGGATWVAIGSGFDPDAFAAITAALARVGG